MLNEKERQKLYQELQKHIRMRTSEINFAENMRNETEIVPIIYQNGKYICNHSYFEMLFFQNAIENGMAVKSVISASSTRERLFALSFVLTSILSVGKNLKSIYNNIKFMQFSKKFIKKYIRNSENCFEHQLQEVISSLKKGVFDDRSENYFELCDMIINRYFKELEDLSAVGTSKK